MANDQTSSRNGFDKWQDGINNAVGNARWNSWDCEIQGAVNEYNRHLAGTPGYLPLDWRIIKAMIWVETGANNTEWKTRPMQIGVPGDPGLASLFSGVEGGQLIMPSSMKIRLTKESARSIPAHNIQAGTGYLLMRMANFEYRSVAAKDSRIYEVIVKPGDTLDRIAKHHGSTIEIMKRLNPAAHILKPGQTLEYQKGAIQRVIKSWRHISTTSIAQRYNGGGDPHYARKLDHALNLLRNGKESSCAQ